MSRSTSFYYSFLVLPREKRLALTAVFDFCRAVDDAVDLETDSSRAREAVRRWREDVRRMFSGEKPMSLEAQALQPFLRRFPMPRAEFDALVDGVEMDIEPRHFGTFDDLEPYCHRVASSVGLMCAEIFGYRDPVMREYARDLGVALQLTNILRDVGVDLRKGRVYLPQSDLERFGASREDLRQAVENASGGLANDRLRAVLEHHASRARVFFSRAVRVLPPAEAANFLPAEIMRAIYWDLLERIESAGFDVFREVIRVPRPRQARLALRTWWRSPRPGR